MIRNSVAVVAYLAIALHPRDSIFTEGSASPTWPACKDMGKDYNGFDYKKGLRFSRFVDKHYSIMLAFPWQDNSFDRRAYC